MKTQNRAFLFDGFMLVNILQKSVTFVSDQKSGAIFYQPNFWRILTKTSILMQNCIEDDMGRRNWQNI